MSRSYSAVQDTIVAVSSARGHGLRGIVRLSGPGAVAIISTFFRPAGGDLLSAGGFTLHEGEIVFDSLHRIPAAAYLFRAPRSYTRQDLIELHTVGSPPLLDMVVEWCVQEGARLAEPGEFTARAFLSGAISLPEAEAVASTIRARSDEQLRAARRMKHGELGTRIAEWQDELTDLLALVVADIDFAEEPIDFISPEELKRRLDMLRGGLEAIITTSVRAERLEVLPHVLLLGPPNAGKSTLLNRLSGIDRAIASAAAGTTRDVLAEPVRLGSIEAVMLDAAGVDDSPDAIVAHGRQRALEAAATVELVCLVFDASRPIELGLIHRMKALTSSPTLIVGNKVDELDAGTAATRQAELASGEAGPAVMVSAVRGDGIEKLRRTLEDRLADRHDAADDVAIVLSSRQRAALTDAREAIQRCGELCASASSVLDIAELVAVELQEALEALGVISGRVTTEDLLGRIFSSFCIGK